MFPLKVDFKVYLPIVTPKRLAAAPKKLCFYEARQKEIHGQSFVRFFPYPI